MIISNGPKSTLDAQGIKGSSGFAISNSAHMFSILSDGLYSDKIGAVLREIGCNANDAHIMVGKADVPFEVKLPNILDSSFHVKDFGPGLDDHEVLNLYTTYGWSSKQNSNEVTGAFGLGSKSPFAYTDSFSICSAKDGIKRIYTAHKNDEGKPIVSLLSEGPSDAEWPTGVMVTFAVAPSDFREFIEKAGTIFCWFKVPPSFTGASVSVARPEFMTEGSNFTFGAPATAPQGRSRVVMANVAYPLVSQRLEITDPACRALLDVGVTIFLPTGTVMPTPNREDLQYDKKTKVILSDLLKGIAVEVAKELHTRISALKTGGDWAWNTAIQEYFRALPSSTRLSLQAFVNLAPTSDEGKVEMLKVLRNNSTFLGYDIGSTVAPTLVANNVHTVERDRRCNRVWYYSVQSSRYGMKSIKRREIIRGTIKAGSSKEPERVSLSFGEDVRVIVADATSPDARIRNLLNTQSGSSIKVILVQAIHGAGVEFATSHAKLICGLDVPGTGGIPLSFVSELAADDKKEKFAASPKTSDSAFLKSLEEEHHTYFSLTDSDDCHQTRIPGLDVPESDMFYIVSRAGSDTLKNTVVSSDGLPLTVSYSYSALEEIATCVAKLRQVCNFEGITGFYVLSSQQARILKSKGSVWKEVIPELTLKLNDPVWAKAVFKDVSTMPSLPTRDQYGSRVWGAIGILAYAFKNELEMFKLLEADIPEHALIRAAKCFSASNDVLVPDDAINVRHTWSQMNSYFQYPTIAPSPQKTVITPYETRDFINKAFPSLCLVNFDSVFQFCAEHPKAAANVIKQALSAESDAYKFVSEAELEDYLS